MFSRYHSKTILLIKEIGRKGIGVTMDYGHAIYGGCNPAEEISLCHSCGIPYYVHINDNDAKWDWDYFCGSKHIVENLEFVYYLKNTDTTTTLPATPHQHVGIW